MSKDEFPKFRILLMDKKGNKTNLKIADAYPCLTNGIYAEDKSDYFLKKYKKKLWEATLKKSLHFECLLNCYLRYGEIPIIFLKDKLR
jgi:hypothetical protein